jgi:hypothetical protein
MPPSRFAPSPTGDGSAPAAGDQPIPRQNGHIARAKAKIGLQNLAYNMRRLVTLEGMAAA